MAGSKNEVRRLRKEKGDPHDGPSEPSDFVYHPTVKKEARFSLHSMRPGCSPSSSPSGERGKPPAQLVQSEGVRTSLPQMHVAMRPSTL